MIEILIIVRLRYRTDEASKCLSSVTPHPIRRGYITQFLTAGVPVAVISERCNVSLTVIDQHYDGRSEDEKTRKRQRIILDALGSDQD